MTKFIRLYFLCFFFFLFLGENSAVLTSVSSSLSDATLKADILNNFTIWTTNKCEFCFVSGLSVTGKTCSTPSPAVTCTKAMIGVNAGKNVAMALVQNTNNNYYYLFNGSNIYLNIAGTSGVNLVAILPVDSELFWVWHTSGSYLVQFKGMKISSSFTGTNSPNFPNFVAPSFSCPIGNTGEVVVGLPDQTSGTTALHLITKQEARALDGLSGAFSSCLYSSNSTGGNYLSMSISTVGFGLTFEYVQGSRTLVFSNQYFILPTVNNLILNGVESETENPVRFWISKPVSTTSKIYRDNFDQNIIEIFSFTSAQVPIGDLKFFKEKNVLRMLSMTGTNLYANDITVQQCSNFVGCSGCLSIAEGDPFFCRWNEVIGKCIENNSTAPSHSYSDPLLCPSMSSLSSEFGPAAGNQTVQFALSSSLSSTSFFSQFSSKLLCNWIFNNGTATTTTLSVTSRASGSFNASCLTPIKAKDGISRIYVTLNGGIYVNNEQSYNFGSCNLASTSYLCSDNSLNHGFTTCGWCNSKGSCSIVDECNPSSTWNVPLLQLPNVTSLSSSEFIIDRTYTVQIRGNKFLNTSLFNYHVVLKQAASSYDDISFEDTLVDGNPDGLEIYTAKFVNSNTLNFTFHSPNVSEIFSVAVYQNQSLMVQNMTDLLSPNGFALSTFNCSEYTNCSSCPLQVCGWCQGKCSSNLSNGPCITQFNNATCEDTVPRVTFVGEGCERLEGEKLKECSVEVILWFAPNNTNISISFTGNFSDAYPLSPFNETEGGVKRDAGNSNSQNKFLASNPFQSLSSPFQSGSYSPTIYSNNSPLVQALAFTVFNCGDKASCETCIAESSVCNWCLNSFSCLSVSDLQGCNSSLSQVCPSSSTSSTFFSSPSSLDSNSQVITDTNGIAVSPNENNKAPVWPIIVGASVGGFFLILIIVVIVILLIRKSPEKTQTNPLPPPPDFDTVTLNKDAGSIYNVNKETMAKLLKMEEVLLREGLAIVPHLFRVPDTADVDQFAKFYIYLALGRSNGLARELLMAFTRLEVENTKQETTLFRLTSVASAMFTAYSKVVGLEYLWEALAAPIWEMVQAAENQSSGNADSITLGNLELDSDKIGPEELEFLDSNIYQVLMVLSKVFALIRKNVPKMDPNLRRAVAEIRKVSADKFPNSERKAVGSFVFLRYVVPAIVSPHLYSILEQQPQAHAQRMLIMVSRVMQNLANETLPSKKAPNMEKLDQFVIDNAPRLFKMYDDVTNVNDDILDMHPIELPGDCHVNSLVYIHNFLVKNRNKIAKPETEELFQYLAPMEITSKK